MRPTEQETAAIEVTVCCIQSRSQEEGAYRGESPGKPRGLSGEAEGGEIWQVFIVVSVGRSGRG